MKVIGIWLFAFLFLFFQFISVSFSDAKAAVLPVDLSEPFPFTSTLSGMNMTTMSNLENSQNAGTSLQDHDVLYRGYTADSGWSSWQKNGETAGAIGLSSELKELEVVLADNKSTVTSSSDFSNQDSFENDALLTSFRKGVSLTYKTQARLAEEKNLGAVHYSNYTQRTGWQDYSSIVDSSTKIDNIDRIEAIRLRLKGHPATYYDLYYRVHVGDIGWSGWAKNGEKAGSEGYGFPLKGVEIKLVNKYTELAPQSINETFIEKIVLDVPLISQLPELPTGCEITAVAMMLQYAGADVSKTHLATEIPKHTNDPDKGYVGDPFNYDGWTIYPPALSNLVKKYTGSAMVLTGKNLDTIENFISLKRPIVVWVELHGFIVHAITITGSEQDMFYYNDPWTGEKNTTIAKTRFLEIWDALGRRAISY